MKRIFAIIAGCLVVASMLAIVACKVQVPADEPSTGTVAPSEPTQTDAPEPQAIPLPEEGQYLYEYLMAQGMPDITQTAPTSIRVGIDTEGLLYEAVFDDEESIAAATEALAQVRIGEATDEFATDSYNYIAFSFADGQSYGLSLNANHLEVADSEDFHYYMLEDFDGFWNLAQERAEELVEYDAGTNV